mmetsp:Transcript_30/g.24  ORF Transcript_30/g.24 Transcript_30/m.24 type:complete len:216 (+) Transcript_30:78-725(+)
MISTSVAIHRNSAFKVPLPKKKRVESECNPKPETNKSDRISTGVESVTYGAPFLQLVQRLYTSPSSLTGYEVLALRNHPVISTLMETAARLNLPISNFHIPVKSILKPYEAERVQIYFRNRVQIVINPEQLAQADEVHKSSISETDANDHTAETTETTEQEQRIGFYTKKERMERIKKYKLKKQRSLTNNNKVKYAKKSLVAKKRARVNGKFVKA